MRRYNFSVRFTETGSFDVLCRIRFNGRFDARDMINDFPSNVADNYLNRLLRTPGATEYTYRVGIDNSVDIVTPHGTRPVSDSERAILLNLIDFGQDFEAKRPTTIEEIEFPVSDPGSCTAEGLLTALKAESDAARSSMNDLMRQYPSEDEHAAKKWPDAYHDRYFYQVRLEFDADIAPADAAEFENLLEALHQVNMWNGYSADVSAEEAVQTGRTGISYEIEVAPQSISYLVERPACDPAISIVWFWQMAERKLGRPAERSEIFVTAED